jgi:hypothetical protein
MFEKWAPCYPVAKELKYKNIFNDKVPMSSNISFILCIFWWAEHLIDVSVVPGCLSSPGMNPFGLFVSGRLTVGWEAVFQESEYIPSGSSFSSPSPITIDVASDMLPSGCAETSQSEVFFSPVHYRILLGDEISKEIYVLERMRPETLAHFLRLDTNKPRTGWGRREIMSDRLSDWDWEI